jgi:hypothetical protein
MPRATRSRTRRSSVGTPTTQPDNKDNNLSSNPNGTPTQEELEALVEKLSNRVSRNVSNDMSIAVFPYMLEPDKTMSFPFSKDANKHSTKTAMYHPNQFSPKHKPEDNWPEFLKEVWTHLEHYTADGISPEQYKVMLKPFFSQEAWAHIYEDRVSSKSNQEDRALACKTLLQVYTLECYKFEARVRDYNKFMKAENVYEYGQSFRTYDTRLSTLRSKSRFKNYLELLSITRHWFPNERSQFFSNRRCFNKFDAPDYEKITTDIVSEAIAYGMKIMEERSSQKRQLASDTSARPLIKKHRPNSNKTRVTSSSSSTDMPFVTCITNKYTRVFPNWNRWLRSKPLKELVNSAWKNTGAVRNFQSFQLPIINKPLTLTNYEKAFRQEHNLCARCGNHSNSDGKQCELHPLYDDIKINDKSILGRDITSFPKPHQHSSNCFPLYKLFGSLFFK